MCTRNEMAKYWRQLSFDGYSVENTRGGHVRITHPNIKGAIFAAATPSNWRSLQNLLALLKRKRQSGV